MFTSSICPCARDLVHKFSCAGARAQGHKFCINIYDKYVLEERGKRKKDKIELVMLRIVAKNLTRYFAYNTDDT